MKQLTPSGPKWVANQMAAICGELERVEQQRRYLDRRHAELEQQRSALSQVGELMGLAELQAIMARVHVHRAYGGRGHLVAWLQSVLQAAAPRSVDTRTLTLLAEQHFRLDLPTQDLRGQFRTNSLARSLRKLGSAGVAERLHDPERSGGPGLWRWKPENPSINELRAQASAVKERS